MKGLNFKGKLGIRIITFLLALAMIVAYMPLMSGASYAASSTCNAGGYEYVVPDGIASPGTSASTKVTKITSETTTLTSGWYVVREDVTITSTVKVDGDVNVILCDGHELKVKPSKDDGVNLTKDSSLTFYAQSGGTGKFTASNTYGLNSAIYAYYNASLIINGGDINISATGYGSHGIMIYRFVVNGGTVNATANANDSAIDASVIVINNGTVSATGGRSYGITSYSSDPIVVNGGSLTGTTETGNVGIYCDTEPDAISSDTSLYYDANSNAYRNSDTSRLAKSVTLVPDNRTKYEYSDDGLTATITNINGNNTLTERVVRRGLIGRDVKHLILRGYTAIGDDAFYAYNCSECEDLTSIVLPDGITTIGDDAFYGCDSLASINIPAGVTSIGEMAFYECSKLNTLSFPDSVTYFGEYIFEDCTSLTSVTLPHNLTKIADGMFSNCESLTSITIPDSVTSIGESAFIDCSKLSSITIPASVTNVDEFAFEECYKLTNVTFNGTVGNNGSGICTRYDVFEGVGTSDQKAQLVVPASWTDNLPDKSTGEWHGGYFTCSNSGGVTPDPVSTPSDTNVTTPSDTPDTTGTPTEYTKGTVNLSELRSGDVIKAGVTIHNDLGTTYGLFIDTYAAAVHFDCKQDDAYKTTSEYKASKKIYNKYYWKNPLATGSDFVVESSYEANHPKTISYTITTDWWEFGTKIDGEDHVYAIFPAAKPGETYVPKTPEKETQSIAFGSNQVGATYGDGNYVKTVNGAKTDVTYSSSNTKVATVDPQSGTVKINNAGTSVITATAAENSSYEGATASYTLTVSPKVVNVKADDKTSYVGEDLSLLTYTADELVGTDCFSGNLTTTASQNVAGEYKITQGSLAINDGNNGANYTIRFQDGKYTVTDSEAETGLIVKGTVYNKKSIRLTWTEPTEDATYKVFISKCINNKWSCVKTTTASAFNKTKLKARTNYKVFVAAYDDNGKLIETSPVIHVATAGSKYANATKVTSSISETELSVGNTSRVTAKVAKKSSKKTLLWKKHCAKIRYYSADNDVATVDADGTVTAVGHGSVNIYAVAPSGAYTVTTVKVIN